MNSSVDPAFENLPNFRQAGGRNITNRHGCVVKNGLLYRSSRTDFVTVKDKGVFQQLGIKSIIDLRQKSEYERADGEKLLDDMYEVFVLRKGVAEPWKPSLRWGRKSCVSNATTHSFFGRRYLVNLFTMKLIWHYFVKLNFFLRYFSLIFVAIDWIFGSHLFTKFYNYLVVNSVSMTENYSDMLEFGKLVIADVLRLMLQDENMPMLIHCSHGKDRTGVIVAVVMGCLGVDDEVIVDDYAKSEVLSCGFTVRLSILFSNRANHCIEKCMCALVDTILFPRQYSLSL